MTSVSLQASGRFAPSPTGPLHFGSLLAALGSYLHARQRGARWLLRIEDVDVSRCHDHYAYEIMETLHACGFEWDDEPLWQSRRSQRYSEVLARLKTMAMIYPCGCTRSDYADAASGSDGAPVYPGSCRNGLPAGKQARSWRLKLEGSICFDDLLQGRQQQQLAEQVGDIVLLRADGCHAYHLAVVVDDADQGVDHIVRGADLIHSTARQIYLQRLLGLPTPEYAHLPVALDARGEKLSKQTLAAPIDKSNPLPALFAAAEFLGQKPPQSLRRDSISDFWRWALANWSLAQVPRVAALPAIQY